VNFVLHGIAVSAGITIGRAHLVSSAASSCLARAIAASKRKISPCTADSGIS
jgi:seryl-tRNA(Sec) selenium transferase